MDELRWTQTDDCRWYIKELSSNLFTVYCNKTGFRKAHFSSRRGAERYIEELERKGI